MIPLHDDNPTRRFPVITILLIAINVAVFFLWQPFGGEEEVRFLVERAAIPCEVISGQPVEVTPRRTLACDTRDGTAPFPGKNVYAAVLVSMFLHGNLLHIAGNMLFLWVFGNNIEDRMGLLFYPLFYVGSGIVAAFAHIVLFRDSTIPVVGASGAIAGVMGAYLVLFPRARILTLVPLLFIFFMWLPAWLVLGVWFLGQFTISTMESGVATAAHIGGFVCGVVVGLTFLRPPARPRHRGVTPWRPGF